MLYRTATAGLTIVIAVFLTVGDGTSAQAQPAPQATREVVPTPAPVADPAAAPAPETYDSLDAGQDAQAMAERQRRAAVDRQLQTQADIRYYQVLPGRWGRHYARRYAVPNIHVYAPPFAAQEAHRAIEGGYIPAPPFGPWPMPGDFFGVPYVGEPYVDSVEQPQGHEKVWTGPNSYIYRPRQQEPTRAERQPTLAPPQPTLAAEPAAAQLPVEQPPVAPPSLNPPEQEPLLNPVPGPREF